MIKIVDEKGNNVPANNSWASKNIGGLCVGVNEEDLSISLENYEFCLILKRGVGLIEGVKFCILSTEHTLNASLTYGLEKLEIDIYK